MSSKDSKEFVWTNQLVKEFAEKWHGHKHSENMLQSSLDEFIASKQKREWEIVSFGDKSGTLMAAGTQDCGDEYLIKSPLYHIHSVRRLTDTEVFSIKETVGSKHFSSSVIKGFYIKDGDMWVDFENEDADCRLSWLSPIPVKKVPLFTTQDGVAIYDGMNFSAVQKGTWDIIHECSTPLFFPEKWHVFSTSEKAKEFVALNKPLLSVSEIINQFGYKSPDFDYKLIGGLQSQFIEFAKQKIDSNGTK